MPDFTTSQANLAQARAAREAALRAAAQSAEQQKAVRAVLDRLMRRFDPHDQAAVDQKGRLEGLLEQAGTDLSQKRQALQQANQVASTALTNFATFTDPRHNVSLLSDRSPFALFPVRVETRFATVGAGAPQHQLWVRIYPDDCSIDTFEPTLSATELANAQRYWQGIWRAGGIEADERAAWRSLVTAHGSGRASWIVDNYLPTNLAAKPVKAQASDEILVIPTQTALAASEASATAAYWQALWLADGDAAKTQAARVALETVVGAARAAVLIADYVPYNLSDTPSPPAKKPDVALSTAFVVFPADPPTKQFSWSQAPRVNHLADRFVVIGYNGGAKTIEAIGPVVALPLAVGPDPSADPSQTIHPEGGDLVVPDELQWLVDFDRAVAAGMGLKIDLTPAQAQAGFDRLLVLGVELSANEAGGKAALEELLQHHHFGRSGLSLISQGTPTHNTPGVGTGHTQLDDPDQSFDDRKHAPLFTPTPDATQKRDGQWVAELLGVSPTLFATVHGSDGVDQIRARAMQRALWPATLGYWMDKMMTPVFDDTTVESTRAFFTSYVSGRGACPALHIGGQPYGILPTTAFSRIGWLADRPPEDLGIPPAERAFLARLLTLWRNIDPDWIAMSSQAAYVGKAGDAHQILLDIIGLHPSSVEYYSRYAESLTELFNIVNLWGFGPAFWTAVLASALEAAGDNLLTRLGYTGVKRPDILQHFFLKNAGQITNVIDDRPLSETDPIRAYTDDGQNYIRWLFKAAVTSLDALVQEQGFRGGQTPESLLYLFLRHALLLGYYDASYNLHRTVGFSPATLQALKHEPTFVHVADGAIPSESRFALLYKTEPHITSSTTTLVSDFITKNIHSRVEIRGLFEQVEALQILASASTASLERLFAEHLDCCSYRFDAWLLGLVNVQLQAMRYPQQGGQPATRDGVYLGAYAWLEDLRPSKAQLTPVQLPPELANSFPGPTPIMSDPSNGGYIHAPSLTHAKTAAVLRSGYLANATPANPGVMSINLSSDRVRLALAMLEGIRNGQSLGALLGYRFERGLHDDHGLAEVDQFIYPMRKAFPLAADGIATTKTPPDVPIEAIEARNVLDGLKLITQIRTSSAATYPFGVTTLPPANAAEAAAINAEANGLLDVYDAIADLALAEGVHQAVQGNFERIAATLNAYTTGHFPPEPEVVQTPPAGIALTHRVAVHFQVGLGPPANPTPRAKVEPALDAWLEGILPPLSNISCQVVWNDPVSGAHRQRDVTLADLGVRPLDLLAMIKPDAVQAMTELDDRILGFVIGQEAPRPDASLRILYLTSTPGTLSIFQALALLRNLAALVSGSRPLRATDALLHNDAAPQDDATVFVDRARIASPKADLDTLSADVRAFLDSLEPLLADRVANRAAIVAGVDGFLDQAVALLDRAARFNLPLSGWGFAYAWKHAAFVDLLATVGNLLTRWNGKLADYDTQIAAYDALPADTSDDVRFRMLRAAEILVTTQLDPLPPAPATLRAALDGKRATFSARRDQFQALADSSNPSFANALAAAKAIPVSDLDTQPLDLSPFEDRAVLFAEDLHVNLTGRAAAIAQRRTAVQAQLDAHDAAASASARVAALQAAAKALLGEEFQVYPEFSLSATQADEWANALAASMSGSLTQYLVTTAGVDFPVDEWLYGIARVHPNMRAWEQTVMLAGTLGRPEPTLVPAQFPYEAGAPWLALPYPSDYVLDSDRLLYTAQYVKPFDKTARQCGLLVDEWTEVIPASDRTTGITFNFDRPNNEAPQALLLVTPATASGAWQWDDLVGALNETLDLAKKRALEPIQIDNTAYARFLPATVMAASVYGISITTTLAAANGVFQHLEVGHG